MFRYKDMYLHSFDSVREIWPLHLFHPLTSDIHTAHCESGDAHTACSSGCGHGRVMLLLCKIMPFYVVIVLVKTPSCWNVLGYSSSSVLDLESLSAPPLLELSSMPSALYRSPPAGAFS